MFDATPALAYKIIPPKRVRSMILSGKGTRLLKSIRKRYFKDEFVLLWNLLYAFFSKCEKVNAKKSRGEALIAKDFNIVFEAMTKIRLHSGQDRFIKSGTANTIWTITEYPVSLCISNIPMHEMSFRNVSHFHTKDLRNMTDLDCDIEIH